MTRPKAAISWSGGKDCCAALLRVGADLDVVAMATMVDEDAARSRSHGLRPEVLDAQAGQLGLRRYVGRCTWRTYDAAFDALLERLEAAGISHVVFGDILFPEHRRWAEDMCARRGLVAVEPLFGQPTPQLFREWVEAGCEATIVTTRAALLDASWLGRTLSLDMLQEFERLGVDPCGERGEYHTVVTSCPLFRERVHLAPGPSVQRADCWALDVTVRMSAGAAT
jgi:uncharacterized protein (TIGR00290 family)